MLMMACRFFYINTSQRKYIRNYSTAKAQFFSLKHPVGVYAGSVPHLRLHDKQALAAWIQP